MPPHSFYSGDFPYLHPSLRPPPVPPSVPIHTCVAFSSLWLQEVKRLHGLRDDDEGDGGEKEAGEEGEEGGWRKEAVEQALVEEGQEEAMDVDDVAGRGVGEGASKVCQIIITTN